MIIAAVSVGEGRRDGAAAKAGEDMEQAFQ
jgi:hypothetical protein